MGRGHNSNIVEVVVLGLLAALIIALAVPMFSVQGGRPASGAVPEQHRSIKK